MSHCFITLITSRTQQLPGRDKIKGSRALLKFPIDSTWIYGLILCLDIKFNYFSLALKSSVAREIASGWSLITQAPHPHSPLLLVCPDRAGSCSGWQRLSVSLSSAFSFFYSLESAQESHNPSCWLRISGSKHDGSQNVGGRRAQWSCPIWSLGSTWWQLRPQVSRLCRAHGGHCSPSLGVQPPGRC